MEAKPMVGPASVQEYLNTLSAQGVEQAARCVLEGCLPTSLEEVDRDEFNLGMLKWALSGSPDAELQWSAVVRCSKDPRLRTRDRYLEEVWAGLLRRDPKLESLSRQIELRWDALEVYRAFLFRWFLLRFNLPAALRVYRPASGRRSGRWGSRLLHPLLAASAAGTVTVAFAWGGVGLLPGLGALGVLAFLAAGFALALAPLPPLALSQALLPRLGATVGVGYLFLAAGVDLVRAVYEWGRPAGVHYATGALLVAGVFLYVTQHVHRRVRPPLAWRALLGRALAIFAVGIAYAAAGLALAGPALFSQTLLGPTLAADATAIEPAPHHLFLVAAVALALGMVLQLVWDEQPMTEPL